jgi:hypothetical protein
MTTYPTLTAGLGQSFPREATGERRARECVPAPVDTSPVLTRKRAPGATAARRKAPSRSLPGLRPRRLDTLSNVLSDVRWVKLSRIRRERCSRRVAKVPTTDIIDSAALRRFGHVEEPFFSCRQGGGSPPPAATGPPSPSRAVSEQHLPAVLPATSCLGAFWTPVATVRGRGLIPASKNLVWGLGSQAENSQHAIFSFNSISLFDCRGHRAAPVQFRFLERRFDMRDLGAVLDHEGSLPHPARDQVP